MGCRVTLPNGEHQLRSDVSFRCGSQSIHHRGYSVFGSLPLDVITCIPSEPMHMIYVGFTKKPISLWKNLSINRFNGMDQSIFLFISLALELCTNHTTCDFQMKCRSLYEVSVWKTTECRLFLSYLSSVVLHDREIKLSIRCGFATAKQAARRYAEEVYFQSVLNQYMADNLTEPEVNYDSSKEIITYRNSKLSTTRPDNVVIANGQPGAAKQKSNDYLCNFEELDVAEVEAGFTLVDFPVVNISTGNFSLIAKQMAAQLLTDVSVSFLFALLTTLLHRWDEISAQLESHNSTDCRDHYDKFYMSGIMKELMCSPFPFPLVKEHTYPNKLFDSEAGNNLPCYLRLDHQKSLGYLPYRDEFEINWFALAPELTIGSVVVGHVDWFGYLGILISHYGLVSNKISAWTPKA
ncbi:unnamed protein product [Schistosoma margrebowiei]|uniref:Uncharacterized protein n=1 Tax=Schistosoma margrebowiei TaxID=48269 RepID=A0A183N288_9TREM|nr:unnamed protein product [Schistosoma margrebowiei]